MPGRRWTPEELAAFRRMASGEAADVADLVRRFGALVGRDLSRASVDSLLLRHGISARGVVEAHARNVGSSEQVPSVRNTHEEQPEVDVPAPPVDWTGARPQTTGTGLERRLILGDLHVPFHNLRACAAVLALARALQPHRIVQLGDLFNMGAVSHHPRPFGGRENHSRAMLQGRAFLEALRKASPGSDLTILLGNHDLWAEEYEDEHPELAGCVVPAWLTAIGARVVGRDHQPLVLGPVAYRHGYGGGEHFAKRYAIDDGPQAGVRCIIVGHHHTFQRFHAKNGIECWGAGWLGESRHSAFHYAKNPRHWEVGVLVQDIMGDRVTTTPVRIENGAALFGGRLVAA